MTLTAPEIAKHLSCSVQQVYRLIQECQLPAVRIGSRGVRVTLSALEAFVRRA